MTDTQVAVTAIDDVEARETETVIPPYWLDRRPEWLDESMNPTSEWNRAAFVCEGGEYVRIVKKGDVYDQLDQEARNAPKITLNGDRTPLPRAGP